MIALPPIHFDRASGALEGANLWERTAALALATGSKISSHFSHRGYIGCANLLRKTLPERNIAIKLNADAIFEFPYGDGYWSKLLDRSYRYEDELELLFRHSRDVDYTLLDCGANYGYWSVLVTSRPFGAHRAIAVEPSSANYAKLANNARINGVGGTIEEINLRTIVLRDNEGAVQVFPNGTITTLANLSKQYAYAVVQVRVAYNENIDRVTGTIREVGDAMRLEAAWRPRAALCEPMDTFLETNRRLEWRPLQCPG